MKTCPTGHKPPTCQYIWSTNVYVNVYYSSVSNCKQSQLSIQYNLQLHCYNLIYIRYLKWTIINSYRLYHYASFSQIVKRCVRISDNVVENISIDNWFSIFFESVKKRIFLFIPKMLFLNLQQRIFVWNIKVNMQFITFDHI